MTAVMSSSQAGHTPFSSSPGQWQLLSDRIEKNIEDVLTEDLAFEDLLDAGQDLRLDLAYTDFYRDQRGDVNAALPSPLDTDTLFNNLAKSLLQQSGDLGGEQHAADPGVQQLAYQIVQELQGTRSRSQTPALGPDGASQLDLAASLARLSLGSLGAAAAHRSSPANILSGLPGFPPAPIAPALDARPASALSQPVNELAFSKYTAKSPLQPRRELPLSLQDALPPRAASPFPTAVPPPALSPPPVLQTSLQPPTAPWSESPTEGMLPRSLAPQVPSMGASPASMSMPANAGPPGFGNAHMPQSRQSMASEPFNSLHAPQPPQPQQQPPPPPPAAGVPPSFQSAFNAAFYAACLANQPNAPVAMVDRHGNVMPIQDVSPYGAPPPPPLAPIDAGSMSYPPRNQRAIPPPFPASPYGRAPAPPLSARQDAPPLYPPGFQGGPPGGAAMRGTSFDRRGPAPKGGRKGAMRDKPQRRAGPEGAAHLEGSLVDLTGKMLSMAKEQHGCRYLQRLITGETAAGVAPLVAEILPEAGALMMDPFGNYLVQKVLDVCGAEQRRELLGRACERGLADISCNMHGTRAVQKLVETIDNAEDAERFVRELEADLFTLVLDANGNHVIQRCLQKFRPEQTAAIHAAVRGNCLHVARHRHGCCVLQRCMDYSTRDAKHALVMAVAGHALGLAQNAFGNYVVQYIFDTGIVEACVIVLEALRGQFPQLSCQKFSSNVVEKALKIAVPGLEAWRDTIVQELIDYPDHAELLRDQFGNYVLQSALRNSAGERHAALVAAIRPHMASLKTMQHGKRILQQLQTAV